VSLMVEIVILLPLVTGFMAFLTGPTAGRLLLAVTQTESPRSKAISPLSLIRNWWLEFVGSFSSSS